MREPLSDQSLADVRARAAALPPMTVRPLGARLADYLTAARDDRDALLAEVDRLLAERAGLLTFVRQVAAQPFVRVYHQRDDQAMVASEQANAFYPTARRLLVARGETVS